MYVWSANSSSPWNSCQIVGFFPVFEENSLVKSHAPFYRKYVYHTCLKIIFNSLKNAQQGEVIYRTSIRKSMKIIPRLAAVTGDMIDLRKMGLFDSVSCGYCTTKGLFSSKKSYL